MIIWFEQKLSTFLLLGRNKRNPPKFSTGNVVLFYKPQRFCIKAQCLVLILYEYTRNNNFHIVCTSFDVGRRDRFLVPQDSLPVSQSLGYNSEPCTTNCLSRYLDKRLLLESHSNLYNKYNIFDSKNYRYLTLIILSWAHTPAVDRSPLLTFTSPTVTLPVAFGGCINKVS